MGQPSPYPQYPTPPPSPPPAVKPPRKKWVVPTVIVAVAVVVLASLYIMTSGLLTRPPGGQDTTPPTTQVTQPADGAAVLGASVFVNIDASDNNYVSKVELRIDGSIVHTENSGYLSYDWNTTQYSDGTHTLNATAYDPADNRGYAEVVVTVDNTPPRVVSATPADGTTEVDLLTTTLEVTFDEEMDTSKNASYAVSVESRINNHYGASDAKWISNRKLQYVFRGNEYPFVGSTKYSVKLEDTFGGYLVDIVGNPLGTHAWTFTTRALNVGIQNQRGYYDAGLQGYVVFGEVVNRETPVIATNYWYLGGGSPLHVDLTYYDASGSAVAADQVLTPWIGGLKNAQKAPFGDFQNDPSQRIASFAVSINATERLWRVSPYEFTISNLQDQRTILGDYEVTGTVSNPGTKQIPVGTLVVVCTFYMPDGKVYDYHDWSNQYILNPAGSDNFTCSVWDPAPYQASTYGILASNLFPPS